MSKLSFTKMNGAGNDFVVLDNRDGANSLSSAQIARLCDRHRGVGADGLLLVEAPRDAADFRMRYYNADGGEAEMCGNGARCFARFAQRLTGASGEIRIETKAGLITARLLGDLVRLQMSEPHLKQLGTALEAAGQTFTVHSIDTGVPHAVIFVDDLRAAEVARWGAALRYHAHFAPRGTNVNFVQILSAQSIAIRTYERGVEAETLACGTGMVASALITHELHSTASPIQVKVEGGDTLEIGFASGGAGYQEVTLTGPADFTFEGNVAVD